MAPVPLYDELDRTRIRLLAAIQRWDVLATANVVRGSDTRVKYYVAMLLRACKRLEVYDSDQRIERGITRMLRIISSADDLVEERRMRRARLADREGEDEIEVRGSCGSDAHPGAGRLSGRIAFQHKLRVGDRSYT